MSDQIKAQLIQSLNSIHNTYQLKFKTLQLIYQSSFDELKSGIETLEKQVEGYLAQDTNSGDQTKSQLNLNSSLQSSYLQSTQYLTNIGNTVGTSNINTTLQNK
ncbi:hypothetical protein ABPG72_021847 [Tetrahymena utriculariae]